MYLGLCFVYIYKYWPTTSFVKFQKGDKKEKLTV